MFQQSNGLGLESMANYTMGGWIVEQGYGARKHGKLSITVSRVFMKNSIILPINSILDVVRER